MLGVRRDVVIVGAGPVGMTLAMELGARGIGVLLIERRRRYTPPEPRCNHVSARSMETFRRLGFADRVRDAGLPPDYPQDVVYATAFAGHELGRVRIPPRSQRYDDAGYADGGWPTPEPPHRINQVFLEPIMLARTLEFPSITLWDECDVESIWIDDNHARLEVRSSDGTVRSLSARFVVGCDGGKSTVRKAFGIQLEGEDRLQRSIVATIESSELAARSDIPPAWMYWILNPDQSGNVIALDGRRQWIINAHLRPDVDEASFDYPKAVRTLLGTDLPYRMVHEPSRWIGRRLLAERFSVRPVFIAGDAAHNWLPAGGYAMNAGIADAVNLGWKISGVLQGWAGDEILATYESERKPVLEQVSRLAMNVRRNNENVVTPEIMEETADGQAARDRLGAYMLETDSRQFACIDMNFGYYYDQSACIAYDGEPAPAYTMGTYEPSTVPGCRAPHAWLSDGSSLFDRFGPGFTIVSRDRAEVSGVATAFEDRSIPVTVVNIQENEAPAYSFPLTLVRPDGHVAWRGADAHDASRLAALVSARVTFSGKP